MTNEELQSQLIQAGAAEARGNYGETERLARLILTSLSTTELARELSREEAVIHARATHLLGVGRWGRADYHQALETLYAALNASQQINDQQGIAKALGSIGNVHNSLSEYTKALEFYAKALNIDEELGNTSGIATHLGNIATINHLLTDYPKALEYYGKALSIDEEFGNTKGVAHRLANIGSLHADISEFPKALEYYSQALRKAEELGNTSLMAHINDTIGNVYSALADYPKALEYHTKALGIAEDIHDKTLQAYSLRYMGNVYAELSDYAKALEYYVKAQNMAEESQNRSMIAELNGNFGMIHSSLADYPIALEYYGKALSMIEEFGDKRGLAMILGNIGLVHNTLCDYDKALNYYRKALGIAQELGNKSAEAVVLGNMGAMYSSLDEYEKAFEYCERAEAIQDELGTKREASNTKVTLGKLYALPSNPKRDDAKAEVYLREVINMSQELGLKKFDAHKALAELYESQERWQEANNEWKQYYALKDEVQSEEARKSAALMEQRRQIAEREKEIAIAKAAADAQMSATTKLLYKVLPQSVATRMINGEEEIADYFPTVSILFADIAGFTPISADMPAIIVVRFLNYVFGEFDRIIKEHGCEKIKTIGDGYMAVCGAPIECADHAERLAAAALEMQERIVLPDTIREYMPEGVKLGVRIGLHTGSIVAGVIGEERFVYDIYSDAVNTAARMESHGEENKIHVSNDFFRHLQNRFAMTKNTEHGFVFEKRGEMEIKGKGVMRTYFLEKA